MMLCLVQDNISSASCWQDILFQILQVDIFPDILRHGKRFFAVTDCVVIIVVIRIFKGGVQQGFEPFDIPTLDHFRISIDVDRQVEKVTDIDLLIGWQL